jgi:hypothetical protein
MALPRARLLDRDRLQNSLQELTSSANKLNSLSDELNKQVSDVESAVNKIGIGLSANVNTETWSDERGEKYDIWRICYEKHAGKWGFTIEHLWGHEGFEDSAESETWAFKDAPREHRLRAVEKIPDLIDALVKKSNEFATDVSTVMSYAQGLAAAFTKQDAVVSKK